MEIKISQRERDCLVYLASFYGDEQDCTYFRVIAKEVGGITEKQARRAVRSLARKGLAEYVRGLFNDDGMVAGSGYRATKEGALLVSGCTQCKVVVADMDDGTCLECWRKLNKKEIR